MKKISITVCFMAIVLSANAQWQPIGTSTGNIYYSNGNVGIGNSIPSTHLDVTGHINVGGTFSNPEGFHKSISLRGTQHSIFRMFGGTVSSSFLIDNTITEPKVRLGTNSSDGFGLYTSGAGNVRLYISPAGNVGIGTMVPGGKLQIDNPSAFNSNELSAGQDHILLSAIDPGNGGYFGGVAWESGGRRRAAMVATREHTDLDYVGVAFFTQGIDGPGSMYESMRITHAGNVGIGTSIPDAKLAVKGHIHTQEVRVDLAGAVTPDYVFEKEYHLLPLSDLETYITQNKHLPEVPSAKEMEADGLNLKEMNLVLLKKVEELTLHLIEMKKAKDHQDSTIQVINLNMIEQQKEIQQLHKIVTNYNPK